MPQCIGDPQCVLMTLVCIDDPGVLTALVQSCYIRMPDVMC